MEQPRALLRCGGGGDAEFLVEKARQKLEPRRGPGRNPVRIDEGHDVADPRAGEILDVHDALEALANESPVKAELVKLRYFGGLCAGDLEGARKRFRESSDLEWCSGLNDLAEAIVLHHQGRSDEARIAFERGRDWCSDAQVDSWSSVFHCHDRIAARLLLREAGELLKMNPGE